MRVISFVPRVNDKIRAIFTGKTVRIALVFA